MYNGYNATLRYFAEDEFKVGQVVSIEGGPVPKIVPYDNKKPFGIILDNVVKIDLTKSILKYQENQVQIGSMANVVISGIVVLKLGKSADIGKFISPTKNGNYRITKNKTKNSIGLIVDNDRDGFFKVKLL